MVRTFVLAKTPGIALPLSLFAKGCEASSQAETFSGFARGKVSELWVIEIYIAASLVIKGKISVKSWENGETFTFRPLRLYGTK